MKFVSLLFVVILTLFGVVSASEIAVTVYNSDLGVISELRTLRFSKGVDRLAFRDVPSRIDPNSVQFSVESDRSDVKILEQNYQFDLVSSDKVLNKYIDEQIELIDKDGALITGKLLAHQGGSIILEDDSGKIQMLQSGNLARVSFPKLPEGLITRPTLFWLYQSDFSGELDCRVSYQTGGMSWAAEYVGVLSTDETKLDLSGWAAINNQSGKTYRNATLKLVAGDIHRAHQPRPRGGRDLMKSMVLAEAAPGFEEKAFFEYHLYTLPRKATVADREIKQISLFDPASADVEKIFRYRPDQGARDIEVSLKLENSRSTGLGLPLPAGRVRIFKADDDGSLLLLGEDRIKHTPVDERVTIKVGTAFDLVGQQQMVDLRRISKKVEERDFEIELRNRKTEAVTIEIEKNLFGDWEITTSDFEYTKKNATTLVFHVPVPAGKEKTISFTVRTNLR